MKKDRLQNESGIILLEILGVLAIVFALAGVLLPFAPMQVMADKAVRVDEEMRTLVEAIQKYAADAIAKNYPETGALKYATLPSKLTDLVQTPADASQAEVWNGPYLSTGTINVSKNYASLAVKGDTLLNPYGGDYLYSATSETDFTLTTVIPPAPGSTSKGQPLTKQISASVMHLVLAEDQARVDLINTILPTIGDPCYFKLTSELTSEPGFEWPNTLAKLSNPPGSNFPPVFPADPRLAYDPLGNPFPLKAWTLANIVCDPSMGGPGRHAVIRAVEIPDYP